MTTSIPEKTLAVLAAAVLACVFGMLAFTPLSAHAAQQDSTPLVAQAIDLSLAAQATDAPLAAQASAKKAVYLRKALNDTKYTYNKNGLVTKITGSNYHWDIKYKGTKIVKITHTLDQYGHTSPDIIWTFQYDSKNRTKKMTVVSTGMPNDFYNNTETYFYNSKNRVTKKVTTYTSGSPKSTTKYSYNSAGLVKKIVSPTAIESLKYDSKGNKTSWSRKMKTGTSDYDRTYRYKNTYSNGRLVKVVQNDGSGDYVQTIKYAKKSIAKKYVAVANAQQTALRGFIPGVFLSQLT